MSSPSPRQHGQAPTNFRSPQGAASVHLDALRGIAAVGVCLNHLRDLLLSDYSQLSHPSRLLEVFYLATGLGAEWVIVFFVLSGYLVGGSVLRSFATDRWSWRSYLLSRMTRLYAVLIPALLLGGMLDFAGIHHFGTAGIYGGNAGTHELRYAVQTHLNVKTLLGNYLFLQGIRVPVFGSNGPLWSLANEFWYYLAFPFMVFVLAWKSSMVRRVLSLAALTMIVLFVGPAISLLGLIWLMGAVIHFLPSMRIERPFLRRLLPVLAVGACAGTLAWCKYSRFNLNFYLLGAVVTGMIYVFLSCSHAAVSRSYQWTAHALSRSSYTLYLVHLPFVIFLVSWVGRIRLAPRPHQLLVMLAIFLAAMAYAQIIWFLFEKRTDTLRTWLKPFVLDSAQRSAKKVTKADAQVSS
jgi:peptidoglycan/LPS O-acetylase OafA/YrhL